MVRGYLPVPRPSDMVYAPIDLAVDISEGLADRGHAVEFYGPEGTHLHTAVQTMGLRTLVENQDEWVDFLYNVESQMNNVPAMWDMFLAREMFKAAHEGRYDLLHFHHPEIALPFTQIYPDVPVAFTLHDPLTPWKCDIFGMYLHHNQYFISISDSQRKPRPNLPYAGTVYNGINLDMFPFSEEHDDYLLFSGRIVPEKGLREAVQVALETNNKLLIVGMLYPAAQEYFDEVAKPYLGDQIKHIGFVERAKLADYYKRAKALLFPIQWEEPFGLTMVEAMACGAPVLAFHRGSVPEVVVDGRTGFVVDTVEEMASAVKKIDQIDRKACRRHVQRNFSTEKMVESYETTFENIIKHFAERDHKQEGLDLTVSEEE